MAVREGKWRCPFCSSVNLWARLRPGQRLSATIRGGRIVEELE